MLTGDERKHLQHTGRVCARHEAYICQRLRRRVLRVSGTGVSHLLVGMPRVGGAHDVRLARGGYERGQVQIVPPASRLPLFALAPRRVVVRSPVYVAAIHHHVTPPPSRVSAGAGCEVTTRVSANLTALAMSIASDRALNPVSCV